MEIWLNEIARRDILDKVYILIGITPLKSAKMTHYMTQVPGVYVPDPIIKRMEEAEAKGGPQGAQEEGVTITLEIIEKIKGRQGIHGLHLMPVGWEEIIPRLVTEGGLLPRDFAAPASGSERVSS